MKKGKISRILVFALTIMFLGCVSAMPLPLEAGKVVKTPTGTRDPRFARYVSTGLLFWEQGARLSEQEHMILLQDVLDRVHRKFKYYSDLERFGVNEYWALPYESNSGGRIVGDCDDFALYIREELALKGVRSRLVVVMLERSTSRSFQHMVVEADGYIIDNRYPYVMTTGELEREYEWLAVSDYDLSLPWREARLGAVL